MRNNNFKSYSFPRFSGFTNHHSGDRKQFSYQIKAHSGISSIPVPKDNLLFFLLNSYPDI